MAFRFGLQKILEHRKTLENLAQRDFQEADSARAARIREREEMVEALHKARLDAGKIQAERPSDAPEKLKQIHEFTVLQKVRIERQEAKVREAEKLVEDLREILRQKAIDFKIMERLKERRKTEYVQEKAAEERKDLDDMNVIRFRFKEDE